MGKLLSALGLGAPDTRDADAARAAREAEAGAAIREQNAAVQEQLRRAADAQAEQTKLQTAAAAREQARLDEATAGAEARRRAISAGQVGRSLLLFAPGRETGIGTGAAGGLKNTLGG